MITAIIINSVTLLRKCQKSLGTLLRPTSKSDGGKDSPTIADMTATTTPISVSCLHLLGFPKEMQTTMEDLPFEGVKLFFEKTNTSLHFLKYSRAALRSLGIYTLGQKRHFSPQSQHRLY